MQGLSSRKYLSLNDLSQILTQDLKLNQTLL